MNRQHSLILAVLFMIFYNVACGLHFTDCGSKTGKLTKISVSGCNTTSDACALKLGTNVSITIDFTVSKEVTAVLAAAHGADRTYLYGLGALNGCENIGLKCPLQKGANHEYKGVLEVMKDYPAIQLLVKWQLLDKYYESILCVQFPAKFV